MSSAEKASITIRPMTEADYPQVQAILQEGMDTGEATFERTAPEWEVFKSKRLMNLAFVAEERAEEDTQSSAADSTGEKQPGDDEAVILGWTTASPISHREVFRGVVEDSIYVAEMAAGKGVAGRLIDHLLQQAAEQGYWAMHSHIFPENTASIKLHESRGFRPVGILHSMSKMEYGPKAGQWRNNMLLEKVLEGGPAWESFVEKHGEGTEGEGRID